jgi:hypothetical protein
MSSSTEVQPISARQRQHEQACSAKMPAPLARGLGNQVAGNQASLGLMRNARMEIAAPIGAAKFREDDTNSGNGCCLLWKLLSQATCFTHAPIYRRRRVTTSV